MITNTYLAIKLEKHYHNNKEEDNMDNITTLSFTILSRSSRYFNEIGRNIGKEERKVLFIINITVYQENQLKTH